MPAAQTVSKVEAARNDLEAALGRVAAIRAALVAGDQKLTPADLRDAKTDVEFAELRLQAAEEAERRAFAAERKKRLLELQKQLAALVDVSGIARLETEAETAIDRYVRAVRDHTVKLRAIRDTLRGEGFLEGTMPGPVEDMPCDEGDPAVIGSVSVETIPTPKEKVTRMADAAFRAHFADALKR